MTRSASGMKMSMGQYGRRFGRRFLGLAFGGAAFAAGGAAFAADEIGQPHAWGFDLQQGVTPVMESIARMHNGLLVVITLITLFVTALLVVAMVRFNARSNPVPSKTTHNTMIEVAWTIIPVLILVGIAVPSFRL